MTMAFIQQVSKIMFKINRNKMLFVTLVLFLFPFVFINISCALSNRPVRDREVKQYMTEQLKLEIELYKTIYKPEEPIIIKGKIENLSKGTINLAPVLDMGLDIYLKYDWHEVTSFGPIFLCFRLIRKESIIKLQAGESHHFKRIISTEEYIMPNKIGQYELYIIYHNMTENLYGIEFLIGEVKSNVVKFEIK
ncbi:MAG: hypothetical protein HW406_2035 [Candidatus Brocadiaceae bacterium]|nr:hypothetical protein [Candidatus Brocadiaceae bacterium]